jgi:hypothetical protein
MINSNSTDFVTRISNKHGHMDFINLSYENSLYCGENKDGFLNNLNSNIDNFALYCYRSYLKDAPSPFMISKELAKTIYENVSNSELLNIDLCNLFDMKISWEFAEILTEGGCIKFTKNGNWFYHGWVAIFSFIKNVLNKDCYKKIRYYNERNEIIEKELTEEQSLYLHNWLQKNYIAEASLKNPFTREFIQELGDEEMVDRQTRLALESIR